MDIFNKKKMIILENKNKHLEKELDRVYKLLNKPKDTKNEDYLREENKKLTKWIKSILEQFGTIEVHERKSVRIPIYRRIEPIYDKDDIETRQTTVEIIVIPELIITNMN